MPKGLFLYKQNIITMKKSLIILSTLALFAICSCSDNYVSQDFSIEGSYSELHVGSAFEVTVDKSASQITVTTDESIMPKVAVEKNGDRLSIQLKGINSMTLGASLKVVLPYNPDLTSVNLSGASEFLSEYGLKGPRVDVELSGASDFECDIEADETLVDINGASDFDGDINADIINMEISGASDLRGAVEAQNLNLTIGGASDVYLKGYVSMLEINLTGASKITKRMDGNRYALSCDQCYGSISGASSAFIHSDGSIRVDISGGSKLRYTGDASTSGSNTSGGSSIMHD